MNSLNKYCKFLILWYHNTKMEGKGSRYGINV